LDHGEEVGGELVVTGERDGPPVSAPRRPGLGTTVIEAMANQTLDGVVDLDFAPSGVTWQLVCPV